MPMGGHPLAIPQWERRRPVAPVPLWPVRDSPKSVRVGTPKGRPGEVG